MNLAARITSYNVCYTKLLRIMPTGGVSLEKENLKAWFDAGVTCVGMGSNLFPKNIMDNKDWAGLTKMSKELIETIKSVKK